MHKDGKTTGGRGGIRQKYCCPFCQSKTGVCPCNHKNWNNGKKNRGCTKYKTVPNDYRLSIDRSCLYFKRTYALRTDVSVIIPALRHLVKNGSGFETAAVLLISTHWLISLP